MTVELNWAGLASLRLHGRDLVPAFVRVRALIPDGEPSEVAGSLVPGGGGSNLQAGMAVELLLPRGVLGRATLGERSRGLFPWRGQLPWPEWRQLFEREEPLPPRPQPVKRAGFIEVTAASVISPENWISLEQIGAGPGDRVLLDYRPVTEIAAPLEPFLTAAKQIDDLGLKVAMVGSGLLVLGIRREASQLADIERSDNVAIFEDYDEARFWLLE